MADHYLKSIELLDEVDSIRKEIAQCYGHPRSTPSPPDLDPLHVRRRINALNSRLRILLKLADVHATLSVRQALQDREFAS